MMKKIYLLTLTGLMFAGLSAQVRTSTFTGTPTTHPLTDVSSYSMDRAVGDTLLYVPLAEYFVDSADQAAFTIQTFDQDGLATAAAINPPWATTDFLLFFDPTPGGPNLVPIDALLHADTAYYFGGTSWFNPAGCCADDWITMGPITVPIGGASFGYRVRTPDQDFRDGYKVYMGIAGATPLDFAPSDVVYTKNDNSGVIAEDTVWTYRTHNVPGVYAGQPVYFAVQNFANDMFVIYFDEFLVKETNTAGIANSEFEGFGFNQIMPNPATDIAFVNYTLGKTSDVTFTVTDINGRIISSANQGSKEAGSYNYALSVSEFTSGVYFVTVKAGQFSSTKKLIVAK